MSKTKLNIIKVYSVIFAVLIILSSISQGLTAYAATKIAPPKSIKTSFVSTGVKIKWSRVKSAKGYYIYRKKSTSSKFTRIAKITKNTKLSYTDKNAQSGNYYIYAVKSYKGKNTSAYKKTSKKFYLKAPVISSVKNNYASVTIKWKKITGVTGYRLYRKTGSGSWKKIATLKSDSKVKYTDKKVVNGKKYTYSLKAYQGSKSSVRGASKKLKFKKTTIKITLNKTKLTLYTGKNHTLKATPSISGVSVKWESSNKNIVTVNSKGKITAVSEGTAEITAYFTYNDKKYKKTCSVTVKEKEYSIGEAVDLDGKILFTIDSVKAHTYCDSENSQTSEDNVIINYSYENICCSNNIKIDRGNFTISDAEGGVGTFVDDCLHCTTSQYCAEGVSQKGMVAVAVLDSKGDYCKLKLTVNVDNYGKLTAKFKLKIDRDCDDLLSDKIIFGMTNSAVCLAKLNAYNPSTIKLKSTVYKKNDSLILNGKTVNTSTCSIEYSYVSKDGKAVIEHIKAYFIGENPKLKNSYIYKIPDGYVLAVAQPQKETSYDGEINCESVLKAKGICSLMTIIY